MRKRRRLQIVALTLASGLVISGFSTDFAEAAYTKNENVYAKLAADGSANTIYVVNAFAVDETTDIKDYGDYEQVENLTNLTELGYENESVDFQTESGKFYYQGVMQEAQLPWNIAISYRLDGKKINPEELAGQSGKLEIRIQTEKNKSVNNIFYENYMMQISVTLGENCENIKAEDGMKADAGADQNISFTVLPDSDGDFSMTTDVTDFEMAGISIAAVPYSMNLDDEMFDTDEMMSQFTELSDAIQELNDGTQELKDGVHKVNNGGDSLVKGARQIGDGLGTLDQNGSTIVEASAQINDALATISSQLSQTDLSALSSLGEIPGALTQMGTTLGELESGLKTLREGFAKSYAALEKAMAENTAEALTEQEIATLQSVAATDADALQVYQKLMAAYGNLMTIQGTYEAVKPAFAAVDQSLNADNKQSVAYGLAQLKKGLNDMGTAMSQSMEGMDVNEMMGSLQSGMSELSNSYAAFHNGLASYTTGVRTLSGGYQEYYQGLQSYLNGIGELDSGTGELADGVQQLADGVGDMPKQVQSTVDEMMEKYSSSDFEAVSFVDERNNSVDMVQFVLTTEAIKIPDVEEETVVQEKEGFWERIKNLF